MAMIALSALPTFAGLQLAHTEIGEQRITIHAATTSTDVPCPTCTYPARRIHSRYVRTLADLP